MQGPLLLENDFTYQTIKLYQALFKDAVIILSTWEDENADYLKRIENLNITILKSKKPDFAGPSNINLQIKTTLQGMLKAKETGVKYALKTRTDQRIYHGKSFEMFRNLIELFPLSNNMVQKKRLVVPSLGTLKYRMYGITDMMMFGDMDDMLLYWNVEFDNRSIGRDDSRSILDFIHLRVCEIYLCTEFLKKIGCNIEWTLADTWKMYAEHFCIVDHSTINIFWNKYGKKEEYRYKYYHKHSWELFEFSDWLNALNDRSEIVDEKILQTKFGDRIGQ